MVVTFISEVVMAAYALWRYQLNVAGRLVVALLSFLALFQICEYFVCGGVGISAEVWSRIGYVAITMLPPLGLHLLFVLAGKSKRRLVGVSYANAIIFIGFFLVYDAAFTGYQCTGNYVIFQLAAHSGGLFGAYYYGWLGTAIGLSVVWAKELAAQGKEAVKKLQAVRGLRIGYLVFLVPTAIANTIDPSTRRGIPSIMCGFAVLFAIILAFYILPRAETQRLTKT